MAVFDLIACNDLIPPRALFNWVVRTGNPGFDLATINDYVFVFLLALLATSSVCLITLQGFGFPAGFYAQTSRLPVFYTLKLRFMIESRKAFDIVRKNK